MTEQNEENLCDCCNCDYPTCESGKIEFGNGVGDDNIIECETFTEHYNSN